MRPWESCISSREGLNGGPGATVRGSWAAMPASGLARIDGPAKQTAMADEQLIHVAHFLVINNHVVQV